MPVPDKSSDGSETSGPPTRTRRALVRRPALFQNPKFSFRRVLSRVWRKWEERVKTRERGTDAAEQRRRSTTHRCTRRVMALPNKSNSQSSAKPSVGSWHAWLCPRRDQQVDTTHRRIYDGSLGTLDSVPRKVPGRPFSENARPAYPGERTRETPSAVLLLTIGMSNSQTTPLPNEIVRCDSMPASNSTPATADRGTRAST
jgi:hypothetical protein